MSIFDDAVRNASPGPVTVPRPRDLTTALSPPPDPGVFADYDMVVAIPRRVINQELQRLHASGAIAPRLVLVQHVDDKGNFTYQALASPDQIPRGPDGNPTVACIDAEVCPRIDIPASGTRVTLVLQFLNGSVWTGGGFGPLAGVQQHDATGWTYGVNVTLDLAAVAKDDIGKVPPAVQQQLNGFLDADFRVDHLFMDLDSADLLTFDPATTNTGTAGGDGARQLAMFMQFYLRDLVAGGNPFILGYTATATDQTQVPANQNVPDSLRPTGTTFTLYQDPVDPDLSTVNYVLATRGGHGTIGGTPANFTGNWIRPGETCDAKVVYSHSCLAEPLLVAPLFKQVREGVFAQVSQNVSVGEGNDYAAARQPTDSGWQFTISSVGDGDDQYTNAFTVSNGGNELSFAGHVHAAKSVSQNNFFCTAHANAWGDADWAGTITLGVANGALTAQGSFATVRSTSDSSTNSCADAFSWMGRILGGVLDVFTGWADGGLFSTLFASAFSVSIPGIGDLNVVLGNLSASATSVVVLPAGGVFDFAAPAIDGAGNVSLELTCRP